MLRFEKAKEQINNNIVKNLRFKMLSLILCKHWTTYGQVTTSYPSFVYMRTILSGFTNFKLSVLVALFTLNNYAIRSANYACAQPYHPHSRTHGQVPFFRVRVQKLGVSSEKKGFSYDYCHEASAKSPLNQFELFSIFSPASSSFSDDYFYYRRLWLKSEITILHSLLMELIKTFITRAKV